ncbi:MULTISPECIES: putative quinol monooxygenase [Fictibacillus]|uniref:Monooxygenase n=1 Tax=Fictibacillus enclensis TaxID=1017270 RepID=A0A0V8J8B7_9BACL|nr:MULTISPECIES: putative quinol monooxygenase [Fictibacillus]KSU83241.1 monooxygenase [Fictibacillus enclensis]RXZ01985.1 antibiotic biosynthesis monooxygenase [Fictibacillus sp. S7]SCC12361.1 Quinol monooxygenase YgiN [Fictibacillus enclensis]
MILIHAKMFVNPTKEEEFLAEVQQLISASQEESGNVSYELFKDTVEDSAYLMVEGWKDLEAVDAHNKSSHFTQFVGKAQNYLIRPLDVKVFNAQQVK